MKALIFLATISIAVSTFAQQETPAASPAASPTAIPLPSLSPAPDADVLTKLLRDFLAGASRNDAAMHDRFWADDLVYTGSIGRRLGKAQLMQELRAESASPAPEETVYNAEDIRIQQYGDTAIVAFRLVAHTTKNGQTETANYLNTGTFLKRDGQWKAVAWQATKMPTTPAHAK